MGLRLHEGSSTFQNVDRPNHIGILGIATFETLKFSLGWAIFFIGITAARASSAGVVGAEPRLKRRLAIGIYSPTDGGIHTKIDRVWLDSTLISV